MKRRFTIERVGRRRRSAARGMAALGFSALIIKIVLRLRLENGAGDRRRAERPGRVVERRRAGAVSGGAVVSNLSTAVMQRRAAPAKGLDYFPTPPWATRAFLREVLQAEFAPFCFGSAWEPAAGQGHMAEVLGEVFGTVHASDVFDYGAGYETGSFVGLGPDVSAARRVDWIITNPPFNLAVEFAERALSEASIGVAFLLRTSWLEGAERYERLFRDRPPRIIAQYCERVPMVAGRWDPSAASATSYAGLSGIRRISAKRPSSSGSRQAPALATGPTPISRGGRHE